MNQVKAAKRALRRDVIAKIRAMDPADRMRQQTGLVEQFPSMPGFASARTILLYVSAFPEEIDTQPLLNRALELGKRLVLPRVDAVCQSLTLHEVIDLDLDLGPGYRGISEPATTCPEVQPVDLDWLLVPGLAFDPRCHRLGRGAGHYDRLLAKLRPEATTWAMILGPQWVDRVPTEPHDRRLDGVRDHEGFRWW